MTSERNNAELCAPGTKQSPPPMDESWRAHAACIGADLNLFFPIMGDYTTDVPIEAAALCRACPVRDDCLDYALRTPTTIGIWAGTTHEHRRRLRRRHRREATS